MGTTTHATNMLLADMQKRVERLEESMEWTAKDITRSTAAINAGLEQGWDVRTRIAELLSLANKMQDLQTELATLQEITLRLEFITTEGDAQ